MGKAHPQDLRWRAVYGVWWDGLDFATVAEQLSKGPLIVEARWVKEMWERFQETGEVANMQGLRESPPANTIMDDSAARVVIDQILENPEWTLNEHLVEFEASTGKSVHISTFCQAVRRLGFTRQRVQERSQSLQLL